MSKAYGNEIVDKENQKLIEELVKNISEVNSQIKGIKDGNEANLESSMKRVAQFRGRPLFYPYMGSGAGRGPYVELEDGSVKLDLINGIGVNILGHSHPDVLRASLKGAMSNVVMQGNLQPNAQYLEFGEKLTSLASRRSLLKHAWISTCGSVANENALKIVRQKKSPAKKIIALKCAFAGRTTMMAEITDNPNFRVGLPEYGEVLRIDMPNNYTLSSCGGRSSGEKALRVLKELVAKNGGDIAAFMFEPLQGEGGFRVASRDFFIPLLEFCKEIGIAVWADEVQTFCRTGELFCFEKLEIGNYLDICTIAKAAQVGATLYTEEFNPKPGLIAGTFAGSSVSLAVGTEILNVLTSGEYFGSEGKIEKIHKEFTGMLNELSEGSCQGLISEVGGMGLMVAFTPFDGTKEKTMPLLKTLYKNGVIAFACGHGPYRIRFLIPAVLQSEDIEVVKGIIEKSLIQG